MTDDKVININKETDPNEITPEQALRNLDQACGQINATREVHLILSKSVEVLRATIGG